MRFELFVALRYLKAKRRQAAISVITAISVVGVMAGVAALVVALAINNGFREELENKLLGATSNINLLRAQNDGIQHYEELTARLSKMPHVVAAAPALYEEVLISSQQRAQGVVLKGVDPEREVKVGDLLQHLTEGSLQGLSETFPDADPIIIGKDLAKSLGVFVGDTVMVTSPQGSLTPFGTVPKFRHFRVVGVFDSGFFDFDATWAFTNLSAAQQLFDLRSVASVIEFKLDDVYKADTVAAVIRKAAGPGFTTQTWMDQNRSLFSALRLERLVTILTIGLIVLVAALNIFITLVMMVMEKNRDIAVLRSMGAKKKQVWTVFTLHGLLIAWVGTALGLVLGYGTSWLGQHYKLIPLQADIYGLSSVPFHPRPWDGLWIALAALAVSFLATLYPSLAATKLDPAEILRYE
ncbi:MAG TPA: lipoprotein-releasing ABC transporter permease subunit [Terriglobia bacterium]|nr:lipoprotein-releasing ABC transporter permease subunit [Terriglobia bacterium]